MRLIVFPVLVRTGPCQRKCVLGSSRDSYISFQRFDDNLQLRCNNPMAMNIATVILLILLPLAVNGQQRSRAEILREAGRLGTEAERLQGEALKKVDAGADRKVIREAERVAAETFEKAVELWREAGDDDRLRAGFDELTRLYSVVGDYDRVVDLLTREADYWAKRGNVAMQTDMLFFLGMRQGQMKREAAGIETLERVVAMSREAGLRSLEPNALSQLALLYKRVGRKQDAESAEETAKKLWSAMRVQPASALLSKPVPPATIPGQWVDLPGAPAAAEYRVIEGVNEAVLVNRSSKGINLVTFGCVALDGNGKARVLYELMGMGMSEGGVRPGSYFHVFRSLTGPLNRWTDEKMGCEGEAKMTLIEAGFDDQTMWKADGVNWSR